MRYPPEDKKKTRQRIVQTAARRDRVEGLHSVGISNLMADLGLTHGGFYAHFIDKEALVAAVCQNSFEAQQHHWTHLLNQHQEQEAFAVLIRDYLSLAQRDHPEKGCIAAALGGEIARRDSRSRRAFTQGIENMLARLNQLSPAAPGHLSTEAMLGMLVGSMVLARAVSDPHLSERLLRKAIAALLDYPD